ncbi:hypothetical protein NKJ04_17520 [Mesorhizobium sp. M0618]|uniref:hypothetical protein n=1 Tax=Mesorhizobium sp. M0618 TaxID=2956972 RepID=UPI00333C994A
MNEIEIRRIVAETVAETLIKLGIDAKEPLELQADMQHLRRQRGAVEKIKSQSLMAAVGVITLGGLGLLWTAIKGH